MTLPGFLRCRACTSEYAPAPRPVCPRCLGPLESRLDPVEVRERASRESIARGPLSLWRYRDLLPVPSGAEPVDLGAGYGRFRRADRLAAELGLRKLYLVDDTTSPSGSFKDRPTSVAATVAQALGLRALACVSTGNLAGAVAAHAAKAGLPAHVLVPACVETEKLVQTATYGADVIRIEGTYDDANRVAADAAFELPWGFVNINLRPFYAEGSKTLAFEAAEGLGWEAPDHVVHPLGAGASLVAVAKGYRELVEVGLLDSADVRLSGAQPAGCAPIATAVADGGPVRPVRTPKTLCTSLAIGNPADGADAARVIRDSGGSAAAPSDDDIVDAIRLLARTEGVLAEPAGGATLAGLRSLVDRGDVRRDETVVLHVTGSGLKTPAVVGRVLRQPAAVPARVEDVLRAAGVVLSSA